LQEAETPPVLACAYCEREVEARFVGEPTSRALFRYSDAEVGRIEPARRVYFESEAQGLAAGFLIPSPG
jgi:hypothetical protein